MSQQTARLSWRFPRTFWIANGIELFERAAYYGCFIALAVYLTDSVGFTDVQTGWVVACFASVLYLLPTFLGALADRIGFRAALILAFTLLAAGYGLLGAFQVKATALASLALIMVGGAMVKPVITGTVAKCSDAAHRARAFSLFYQVVNIGAFLGKTIAKPLRVSLGLEYINYYAAAMAVVALLLTLLFYHNVEGDKLAAKTLRETLAGLGRVLRNARFMILILIVAGFWAIQGQLYATMPKYMLRLIGPGASPEWLANINPFIVVFCVVPITHLMQRARPITSIAVSLALIPFSALIVSLSPLVAQWLGNDITLFAGITMNAITLTMIFGIALQGLAECFLSPRFYEYASKQAPKGEEGLYMGYQYLTTFFAWLFGFAISGYLLDAFCPDPKKLTPDQLPTAYLHAHYIWYVFAGIGAAAFVLLVIYRIVTHRLDRDKTEELSEKEPIPFIEEE